MKLFVILACVIAVSLAAPSKSEVSELDARRALPALEHTEVRDGKGQYDLSYRTAEGIEVREKGRLVSTPDGKAQYLEIEGETKFIGTDGKLYVTKYSAGLNGSKVEGEHLPVPFLAEPVPVAAQPVSVQPVFV